MSKTFKLLPKVYYVQYINISSKLYCTYYALSALIELNMEYEININNI